MVKIPRRLEELLPAVAMEKVLDLLQQPEISLKVREAMDKVGLGEATPLDRVKDAWQQAKTWLDTMTAAGGGSTSESVRALNATGQLFLPRFCGLPSSASVAYGYAKSVTNYQSAKQQRERVERSLQGLLRGGPPNGDAALLSSVAEALRLLVAATGCSEVIISRTDAVRIPGLGDVRATLEQASVPLREIGAANGVDAGDWKRGLTSESQLAILCSPNNLSTDAAQAQRAAAMDAAHTSGARIVELLADAVLHESLVDAFGFPDPRRSLATGTHLVVLPLHLFLGGPFGGLVLGEAATVARIRETAIATGVELCPTVQAAATTALQIGLLGNELDLGLPAQLLANQKNLKNRARRMAVQISGVGQVATALECPHTVPLGPTPWNRYQLTSWAVRLTPRSSAEELRKVAGDRQQGNYVVEAAMEGPELLLDLRFIPPECDHELVSVFTGGAVPS